MDNILQFEFAILGMGISMCLFMSLFFFMDSKDKISTIKSPRRFLSGFMFVYSLTFLDGILIAADINYNYPNTLGIFVPTYFLLGPFLYFYVRDMCDTKTYELKRPRLKHFIVSLISIITLIPFFALPDSDKQLIFTNNIISAPETLHPWLAIFGVLLVQITLPLQILFYLVQSFRVLLRYFTNLKQFFSNVEDNRLVWLRFLIVAITISWALYTYEKFMAWPLHVHSNIRFMTTCIDVSIIYYLSFKGLRQVAMFRDQLSDNYEVNDSFSEYDSTSNNKQKYAKSALSEEDTNRIFLKLQNALSKEHLYNDSMLSLRSLSDHTNISTNYISQVINQKTDSHFFDYINRFRIDAAKEQLAMKDEKTTVLDIAYNVGFNSKSTFNTAFKRHTDLTPTEYRKLYNLAV
jgi:AraC-like DNA-binding protein